MGCSTGLKHQTLKSYISAVRHLQVSCGIGDPKVGTVPQLATWGAEGTSWPTEAYMPPHLTRDLVADPPGVRSGGDKMGSHYVVGSLLSGLLWFY